MAAAFRTNLPDVVERAGASLLGMAVGDALGASVEFLTPGEIRAQHGVLSDIMGGGWLRLRAGDVTDDTQMSMLIARSIDETDWSVRDIADRFADWLRSRPIDVGNTCRRGIVRYLRDGSLAGPPNDGDAGNGAAMRMTPVAIATLADGRLLERRALEQAHLTHNHPLSDAACLVVGRLIQLGCVGCSRGRLRRCAEDAARLWPRLAWVPYHGLCSAYVVDTLATVLHHFFAARGFEDCLVRVVNQGGDADTAGAIAGAIAGAYWGPHAIPRRWSRRLAPALREEMAGLAARLVERSPLGRGSPPDLV